MTIAELATYGNLVLWFGHAVAALMLGRKIAELRIATDTHRTVLGGLVEGQQMMKARATQIEKQLGRTMRHTGVPGIEQVPEAPVA